VGELFFLGLVVAFFGLSWGLLKLAESRYARYLGEIRRE
jgi:hypothetical protein